MHKWVVRIYVQPFGVDFPQRIVKERDRAGPRHFGTLTKKLGLSAPGARRTRPQKVPAMNFHRSIVGKSPFAWPLPLRSRVQAFRCPARSRS
ncbi:hypothetical protein [Aneurinibacillus soli]|uniref:hypothetical protein n=1 Tax=Aneurinibacillus soli TaxID=1500254 RepID=UPI0011B702FA|nr:hypothetical protein [Aneurinibacillus soli]